MFLAETSVLQAGSSGDKPQRGLHTQVIVVSVDPIEFTASTPRFVTT